MGFWQILYSIGDPAYLHVFTKTQHQVSDAPTPAMEEYFLRQGFSARDVINEGRGAAASLPSCLADLELARQHLYALPEFGLLHLRSHAILQAVAHFGHCRLVETDTCPHRCHAGLLLG